MNQRSFWNRDHWLARGYDKEKCRIAVSDEGATFYLCVFETTEQPSSARARARGVHCIPRLSPRKTLAARSVLREHLGPGSLLWHGHDEINEGSSTGWEELLWVTQSTVYLLLPERDEEG
jgi:hypothetical protein